MLRLHARITYSLKVKALHGADSETKKEGEEGGREKEALIIHQCSSCLL